MSAHRQLVVLLLLPSSRLGRLGLPPGSGVRGPHRGRRAVPDAVTTAAALVFRGVSPGTDLHLRVTTGDLADRWGQNGDYGALGDGTNVTRLRPVAVVGGLKFRQVSAGVAHSCGVTTDNRAYCWGLSTDGALGTGPTPAATGPWPSRAGSVSSWSRPRCAHVRPHYRRPGLLLGNEYVRPFGDGTNERRNVPVAVRGGHTFTQISASWEHTCAVEASGVAWCWGSNRFGQLGTGEKPPAGRPQGLGGICSPGQCGW